MQVSIPPFSEEDIQNLGKVLPMSKMRFLTPFKGKVPIVKYLEGK